MNIENESLIASYILNNYDNKKEIQSYYFQDEIIKNIIDCIHSIKNNESIKINSSENLIDLIMIEGSKLSKKLEFNNVEKNKTEYPGRSTMPKSIANRFSSKPCIKIKSVDKINDSVFN
jgi:hypothetical protein